MASETTGFRDHDSPMLADRLEVFSMALLVLYSVRVAAAVVPLGLLDPQWQLSAVSALLDSAAIPLVALGLLHLAAYLDPANRALGRRRDALARLAILAVLGFLLLIPLQAFAAWNSVAAAQGNVLRQQTTATGNFAQIREAINAATSLDDLQARLQSLQTPNLSIRFENLGLPLAETKRRLLIRLTAAQKEVKTRINAPPPQVIEDVAMNSLRVMSSCAVFAAAFAIAAQRWGSEVPLLLELHTIWSLRGAPTATGPGSGPAGRRFLGSPPAHEKDYIERLAPPEELPSDST